LHYFIEVSRFFLETTWRHNPYRQAAHHILVMFLILAWTAWQRWISAMWRDTVRVLVGCLNVVCTGIDMVFEIDVCSLYWIPCWSEIN